MGTFQVLSIGRGLAIDMMEMPVRLRVMSPQIGENRRMMSIGMGAEEVGATIVQRSTSRREAVIIVRPRFVEVGTKAKGRAIRVRKRRQPDPNATGGDDDFAQPGD